MNCTKCHSPKVIKHGFQSNGKQRFRCKNCLSIFQNDYSYNSYEVSDSQIVQLLKESCGTRSISRICGISCSTVTRRIIKIGSGLRRKAPLISGKSYQVDELFTYVKKKDNRVCIAYSFDPIEKQVLDISVGRRNKTNLKKVTETLVLSRAKKITTDKLDIYKSLIPKEMHSTKFRGINHIERQNLTLRTHIKRLNRRTLAFSKSIIILEAVLKIYFWY